MQSRIRLRGSGRPSKHRCGKDALVGGLDERLTHQGGQCRRGRVTITDSVILFLFVDNDPEPDVCNGVGVGPRCSPSLALVIGKSDGGPRNRHGSQSARSAGR